MFIFSLIHWLFTRVPLAYRTAGLDLCVRGELFPTPKTFLTPLELALISSSFSRKVCTGPRDI